MPVLMLVELAPIPIRLLSALKFIGYPDPADTWSCPPVVVVLKNQPDEPVKVRWLPLVEIVDGTEVAPTTKLGTETIAAPVLPLCVKVSVLVGFATTDPITF